MPDLILPIDRFDIERGANEKPKTKSDEYRAHATDFATKTLSKEMTEDDFERLKTDFNICIDKKIDGYWLLRRILENDKLFKRCISITDGSWIRFRVLCINDKIVLEFRDEKGVLEWVDGNKKECISKLKEFLKTYTCIPCQVSWGIRILKEEDRR